MAVLARERELRHDIHRVLEALAEPDTSDREVLGTPAATTTLTGTAADASAVPAGPGVTGWQHVQAFFKRELDTLEFASMKELHTDPPAARTRPAGPRRQAPSDRRQTPSERRRTSRSLVAYCLGSFQLYLDDQLVDSWNGHKSVSVLKYLLLHHRSRVPKEVLFELFWPGYDPEACRRNLHQAIYSLRHTLRRFRPGVRYLLFEDDCYFLNPEIGVWIDAEEFSERVGTGQRLEAAARMVEALAEYGKAVALYQGHLFEESPYEDWASVERERLRSEYRLAAGRLVDDYIGRADCGAAIVLCQKTLSLDRCDEDAHRGLMSCYEAQGQRHLALRQFNVCADALREDFDLVPDEATVAMHDQLIQAAVEGR